MPSADFPEDLAPSIRAPRTNFLSVIKARPGIFDHLRDSEAITTIKRARRVPPPTRDMIAVVIVSVIVGVALVAHAKGWW